MRQTAKTPAADCISDAISFSLPGIDEPVTSLTALEKALKPRTSVPTQRYARFLALDDETLASAGVTTRFAADHLKRLLQDLRGRSEHVDAKLASIEPGFFSLDHGWRNIFQSFKGSGPRMAAFQLLPAADVMEITAETRDFKFNCAVANIDFFLRHGLLTPDNPDYVDIARGLHR